jgi:hypothetical protein
LSSSGLSFCLLMSAVALSVDPQNVNPLGCYSGQLSTLLSQLSV